MIEKIIENKNILSLVNEEFSIAVKLHLNSSKGGKIPFAIYSYKKELALDKDNDNQCIIPIVGFSINFDHVNEYCLKPAEEEEEEKLYLIKGENGIFYFSDEMALIATRKHKNCLSLIVSKDIVIPPYTLICSVDTSVKLLTAEILNASSDIYSYEPIQDV